MIQISKGLDLPIAGKPSEQIDAGQPVQHVALLGRDYQDMKPTLLVKEGESVKLGQPLFSDKKYPQILFTSPAAGRVAAINRGERRAFQSLVIAISGAEEVTFNAHSKEQLQDLSPESVEELLLRSGLWTSLRTRPYSRIPVPGTQPAALFVTAIDTNPLAANPKLAIAARPQEFEAGLTLLRRLTAGSVYLCQAPDLQFNPPDGITAQQFSGCHPAGLVGTHIHFLEKVNLQRQVWHIGYQDVIAIGHLFLKGQLLTERLVALGGPQVSNPRILRTRIGACLSELLRGQLHEGVNRIISGSVLSGHQARETEDFLGRYHQQIAVIAEDQQRETLGWAKPGLNSFSIKRVFAAALMPKRSFAMTSSNNGSLRAMVPTGAFEKVMPLNVKATWLLRSLLTEDTDLAQGLGCLELDEEDLALCSFVCSGKLDYGDFLRRALNKIEKEG
jgi:Na+-transporting NADH:ubiquinone oxidoreductase subunit A